REQSSHDQLSSCAKTQRRKVKPWKRGSALRLGVFARKIFVVVPRDLGEITKHSLIVFHESSVVFGGTSVALRGCGGITKMIRPRTQYMLVLLLSTLIFSSVAKAQDAQSATGTV